MDRAPISEATRGVVTVLVELGLAEHIKVNNLCGVKNCVVTLVGRAWPS